MSQPSFTSRFGRKQKRPVVSRSTLGAAAVGGVLLVLFLVLLFGSNQAPKRILVETEKPLPAAQY